MEVSNLFKESIANVFYDKIVSVIDTQTSYDDEGGLIINNDNVISTFKANVNYSINELIQKEYGLDTQIDIVVTTNQPIKKNAHIRYDDVNYKVLDVKCFDTHIRFVGTKYE